MHSSEEVDLKHTAAGCEPVRMERQRNNTGERFVFHSESLHQRKSREMGFRSCSCFYFYLEML